MNIAQPTPILNNQQTGAETGFARNLVFVIGINNYQNGISPLKTAVNDAKKLVEVLQEKHKYQAWVCLDNVATLSNINQFLEKTLPAQVTEDDRLLFYFAGHGVALNGDDGPVGYLIPQDAKLGDTNSYLPMTKLHDALSKLPCRHFLGILDCCFAGAFRWSSTRDLITSPEVIYQEHYDRFIRDCAWQIITSSASDQKALDNFNLDTERGQVGNHSPFATALLEALEGAADAFPPAKNGKPAGDGVITATELYLHLRDRVEIPSEKQSLRQTPGIWCLNKHDKGEYIFLDPSHELNLPPAPPLDESKNPYRGLNSFEEEHSKIFFGRNKLVEKLQKVVKINPLTVVLGASGSGKSSLVKAGLIPKLKQEANNKWSILPPIRPGKTPFQALNKALSSAGLISVNSQTNLAQSVEIWAKQHPNSKLLIFIDQSEEVITLCQDESQRQEFFQQLLTAINAHRRILRIVFSLRSDYEPQVQDAGLKYVPAALQLANTRLKNRWQNGKFQVPVMKREELREAIEKPAQSQVMYFQPHNLVEQLIDEVADMPGALPLLSFTLSELFLKYLKRQNNAQYTGQNIDRALTEADYQELGGVMQSLTQRADEEYQALVQKNPACEQVIRDVMLRMVAMGGGELARRRVPLSELEYPPEKNSLVKLVIEQFSRARLLVQGQDAEGNPYVEPAHDVLVRGWEKLLAWKRKEEENLILQRRLTPVVVDWKNSTKPAQHLWNGNPYLDVLNKTLNSNDNWLNQVEAEFIEASVALRDREHQKRKRRRRLTFSGLAGGLVLALGLCGLIWWQWQQAEKQARIARLGENAATVRNLLPTQPFTGLALAIKITGESQEELKQVLPQVQSSLYDAIGVARERYIFKGLENWFDSVAVSPDGKTIVTVSFYDEAVRLWDFKGNPIGKPLERFYKNYSSVAFSPDSKTIAVSRDNIVELRDFKGNLIGKPFKGHESTVKSVAFSPDGKYIVSGSGNISRERASGDNTVRLWDLKGNPIGKPFKGHEDAVNSVAFSPDGKYIVSGSRDKTVRLWDLKGNPIGKPFKGHKDIVTSVAFSPDGKYIVSGSFDKTVRLWDLKGNPIGEACRRHEDAVKSVAFSPDGKYIVSGSNDNTVRLWDLKGNPIGEPLKGESYITSLAITPDGKTIVTVGSHYNTVRLLDFEGNFLNQSVKGDEDAVKSVAFSPDGKYIVSGNWDNTVRLWDLKGNPIGKPFKGHENIVTSVAFSPDGKYIVSGSGNQYPDRASSDNTVRLWDLKGNPIGKPFKGHEDAVNSVAFSPDGKYIASGSGSEYLDRASSNNTVSNNTVRLWDLKGNPIGKPFKGHESIVNSVAFSPNGKYIISGSYDKTLRLWDLKGNPIGKPFKGHEHIVTSVAFSPDGKYIVSGSYDKTARLWDLNGNPIGKPFKGHEDAVNSVAFSSDGKYIVSGGNDNTVRLWDIKGNPIGSPLNGHERYVNSVAFSPDGKYIVSGDKTVRLWRGANWQDWLKVGCNRLRFHPVLLDAQTEETKAAKKTCQKYVWGDIE